MADTAYEDKRIRDEAAGWYAKLNNTTISTETLRAFRDWRNADERRAEAYQEIEEFWRRAAKVENDPEIQRAIGAALAREKEGLGALPRIGPRGLAGAVFVLVLSIGLIFLWPNLFGRTFETAVGEQRLLRLADGSQIRLDTDSKVRVRLDHGERQLQLSRGRAFFDVAHDPSRPFIVEAGDASVRALGTRFEVRRRDAGAQVTLVEGKVRVASDAPGHALAWTLVPGDRLNTAEAAPRIVRTDVVTATSWTDGHLIFRSRPLAEAVAEVNRYSDLKVALDDPSLATLQITAAVDIGDTKGFVAAISELYGLSARQEGRTFRLRASG